MSQSHVSSGPTLVDVLEKLIRMEVVEKKAPINDENNKKKAGYYICDNLSLFYFRYIFRYSSQLKIMDPEVFYDELPTTDYVGRGFCYAARRHEPAGIVYPAEQGMSTMPLSHRVTFGNTFLKMFAAPLMSALVTVPS